MRKLGGFVLLAAGVLVPAVAEARGYRSGTVNTPFGSINTNSPAYQMSGGDPFAAMQIQQQMNMMKAQQQMMQQQMKLEQQFQQKMKNDPAFRKQVEAQQAQMQAAYAASQQAKKKKKRPTFHGTGTSTTADSIKARNDDKADVDTKPAASSSSVLKNRRDDEKPAKTEAKPGK